MKFLALALFAVLCAASLATALRVYHYGAARVRDIAFERIRVEEGRRLLSVWIGRTVWSKDAERGQVDGVVFRDIMASGSGSIAELIGSTLNMPSPMSYSKTSRSTGTPSSTEM